MNNDLITSYAKVAIHQLALGQKELKIEYILKNIDKEINFLNNTYTDDEIILKASKL
ncbi:hypothetical protein KQI86_19250 [Clostridium sp. MSJ-11]|uniref:Uncharacterized protein n=1 Tax=Clostridium mobile TaxID=2841512 RepID=A0ABS6EMI9_9CLOT|nr:hypothetical protein [Clostridium mobile]MBU5486441.1 hypothetical protein [Clostridium mobile]